MIDNLELYLNRNLPWGTIELHILGRESEHSPDSRSIAQPLLFKDMSRGSATTPCLQLKVGEAQQLMDELWRCGIRPVEGMGSAGSFEAQKRHLEDMRNIIITKGIMRDD